MGCLSLLRSVWFAFCDVSEALSSAVSSHLKFSFNCKADVIDRCCLRSEQRLRHEQQSLNLAARLLFHQTSLFVRLCSTTRSAALPGNCPNGPVPVGWRRVMRVFHYRRDGWVRLADADRQQMYKSWWWFVKGSTASQSRWRVLQGGGKLFWGTLSVMVHLLSQQGKGQFKHCCCQLTFFWCVRVGLFVLIDKVVYIIALSVSDPIVSFFLSQTFINIKLLLISSVYNDLVHFVDDHSCMLASQVD